MERPPSSDYGCGIVILFLAVPLVLLFAFEVISYVTGFAFLLLLLAASVWATAWINIKAHQVFRRDVRQKRWSRICFASIGWLTISGLVFSLLRPTIIEFFTTRSIAETGWLWWKDSTSIIKVDGPMVWLTFTIYWSCSSLPLYAGISSSAQFLARKRSSPPPDL